MIVGPEMVQQTTEKVREIRKRMKVSQDRQKSYADKRRKPLEFEEGDHVFLRVTPTTCVGRAIKSRKLSPKFIGPYEIIARVGPVAYQIALPPLLSNIHDVFHVSQLRKYIADPSHIIEPDTVELHDNLSFEVPPAKIADRKIKQLKNKKIPLVKVIWNQATGDATWELEDKMKEQYPDLFSSVSFEDETILRGYTDRLKSVIHHFNQALSLDPLHWVAYEELCILGSSYAS
ncbi:uncharacterized protein LOC123908949 [Trifolium pratense]|uniref:Uncharacterized protein n=1 Tax=Trifolium pratense TaxID=57577 RepID=A0ACB0JIV7_TRIPR|nr:uncharacterized protein LOC123908949 [Trifolium pratense]CAJ2645059.1 unnamed protein product [Trifolium pratense]